MTRYQNISKTTQIFYAAGRKYIVDPNAVLVLPESIGTIYGFLKPIAVVEQSVSTEAPKKKSKE